MDKKIDWYMVALVVVVGTWFLYSFAKWWYCL